MSEYYFINFLDVEKKPDDGEVYVALGGLGFLFVDSAEMASSDLTTIDTNIYKTKMEALNALQFIQLALQKKDET